MIQNPVIRSLYQEQGFLIRRNVFSEFEIQELATEVERVLLEHADAIRQTNLRVRFKNHCTTQEPMFEVFDPFSDLSEVARSVARHPQLLTILESLYGETACVFKDKLIYKPPGAEGVSLHQDWIAWPDFPQSFLTAIIPIDQIGRAHV